MIASVAWERPFVRFLVVGALNTAIGYGIYALLILAGSPASAALLLATCVGVAFNFAIARTLVFRARGYGALARFLLVYTGSYLLNLGLLRIVRGAWIADPLLAQLLCLPIVVIATWGALRAFVFPDKAAT